MDRPGDRIDAAQIDRRHLRGDGLARELTGRGVAAFK
jgi:hypothetical protein